MKLEEIKNRYSNRIGRSSFSIDGSVVKTKGNVTEDSDVFHQRQEDLDWLVARVDRLSGLLMAAALLLETRPIMPSLSEKEFEDVADLCILKIKEALTENSVG